MKILYNQKSFSLRKDSSVIVKNHCIILRNHSRKKRSFIPLPNDKIAQFLAALIVEAKSDNYDCIINTSYPQIQ